MSTAYFRYIMLLPASPFLGDMFVVTDGKRALIEGTETLCGCIGTMDACIRQFYASSGCSREEALIAASYHPAQVSTAS